MAIAGHDTVHRVESSATAGSYNFTLLGVIAAQVIHIPVKIIGNSTAHVPAAWTVTLNGVAATFIAGTANGGSGVFPAMGVFRVIADATGDLALAITLDADARACAVDARYLDGVHATPVVNSQASSTFNTTIATKNVPDAYAPAAAGNVLLADVCIGSGAVTSLAATSGADGAYYDETGTNASSDIETGAAYVVAVGTGAVTIDWDWTTADHIAGMTVEYQPAASGGITGDAAGTMPMAGSGAGDVDVAGDAAGAMPISGTASGGVEDKGDAAGQMPIGGAGTGVVGSPPVTGDGAGQMPISGAAAGGVEDKGDAAGQMPIGGAATGSVAAATDVTWRGVPATWRSSPATWRASSAVTGVGAGQMPLGGTASGGVEDKGAADGQMPMGGSGAGVVGSAPVIGAGAGQMPMGGQAAGGVEDTGAAAGVMPMGGGAAGTVADPAVVTFIILASRARLGFRAIGGKPAMRAIGGGR